MNVLCGPLPMSLGRAYRILASPETTVAYQHKEFKQELRLSRISEEPYVTRRTVPVERRMFERTCEVFDECTFMAQCGTWHRIQ